MNEDKKFIKRTIMLAKKAAGWTSPNPMVGAVLVKDGKIIEEDYHKGAGSPHAEALVLKKAGKSAKGSTLYVNLEPCCHTNKRTPPCTEAIIRAGIKKVVAAIIDPNPQVCGKGLRQLKEAGIEVLYGILKEDAKKLNEAYIKYITTGLPLVTLKIAMSLDGKIALPSGESKWITSEKSRMLVQKMRASSDAILTAIGTVKADNPLLTVRIPSAHSPIRVVIDPELEISLDAKILQTPPKTILVTSNKKSKKIDEIYNMGTEIMFYTNKLRLRWLMKMLAKKGITSVIVEGGSGLSSYLLNEKIVDKVVFFIAPIIIGGKDSYPAIGGISCGRLKDAYKIKDIKIKKIGKDIMVEGYLKK